ncbi:hypothetical protein AB1Y20_016361 [Prymnesium parvum]|uniref:PDZ domain-containing protein n=1 Tax=Prymnesium parvum TaxID=97485 RepID=A0AB34ICL5_PRYPA
MARGTGALAPPTPPAPPPLATARLQRLHLSRAFSSDPKRQRMSSEALPASPLVRRSRTTPSASAERLTLPIHKSVATLRLGVKFLPGHDGAVIESVRPYSPAWLAGLRPHDRLTHVVHEGRAAPIESGYHAASYLRGLLGRISLCVHRPPLGAVEAAALRIQAGFVGRMERLLARRELAAARTLQAHARRWRCTSTRLHALEAVRCIQRCARRHLAGAMNSPKSIRAPAELDELDEESSFVRYFASDCSGPALV